MHETVLTLTLLSQVGLGALLTGYAIFTRDVVVRLLALDALTLVLVAAFTLLALIRAESGYLDIALVLSLLGFTQSVAMARFLVHWRQT